MRIGVKRIDVVFSEEEFVSFLPFPRFLIYLLMALDNSRGTDTRET